MDSQGDIVYMDLPHPGRGLPPLLREGVRRRRVAATTGRCPCGATVEWPTRAERRAAARAGTTLHAPIRHEDDCPAIDPRLGDH